MAEIKLMLIIFGITLFCLSGIVLGADEYDITSPDGTVKATVSIGESITFRVYRTSTENAKILELITVSPISMHIQEHGLLGKNAKVIKTNKQSINNTLYPAVPIKSSTIIDQYNELTILFEGGYTLEFRAYDQGVAYRFQTKYENDIHVLSEEFTLNFMEDHKIYFPAEESFLTHCERIYEHIPISSIPQDKFASLPVLVDIMEGPKLAITEAGLVDYPGMYLAGNSSTSLKGLFPAVALKEKQTRDRTVTVTERADYIAATKGTRSFPWRLLIIAQNDADLIENQMVYQLSPSNRIQDTSWIKPGKVAWDWWNANNITGVFFKAGINTETYKYYIDFASRYGIEYIILDEGWSDPADLFKINPEMDIEEILEHGRKKNVGIILWVVWKTLDDQLEPALDRFEEWGVKGIKVDFMQRDDQWMVNYYWRIAEEAAKRHMLVDFHGSYKPSGLRRAYPNVLTREGVRGLEHVKWSKHPTPEHNVTLPFIRMLAGPMDYTPGAMINAQEKNFSICFTRPMSLGTRCHQLAMYVVFESPLQMLADSPSQYLREKECMEFLGPVPAVWDETKVLEAAVGDYILIARRYGDEWYVGAMTDWTPRKMSLNLSFLEPGRYTAFIYQDGANADRYGNDYSRLIKTVTSQDLLKLELAPGGGWAARIVKKSGS